MEPDTLDERLSRLAGELRYPATPDIARSVSIHLGASVQRRAKFRTIALAATVALALLVAVLFFAPGVRAEIVHFFQIGVVRIFTGQPTETPEPANPTALFTATSKPAITPQATPAYLTSVLTLEGRTTLEEARQEAGFQIRLPAYPPDLGKPDQVYFQQEGPMVILVWLDEERTDRVRMSLHEIGPYSVLLKKEPPALQETQVNGQYAIWTDGPYPLEVTGEGYQFYRLVEGHTLIWTEGDITYRLETDLSLEEAIKIAESLEPP